MTWNVNSVRLRLPLIARITELYQPQLLCLQETKVTDELFPHDALAEMGYGYRHIAGMKSYNGVAILSRIPFDDIAIHDDMGMADCRHISVVVAGMRCHCLYLPAGGDVPDVRRNARFAYKFDYLRALSPLLRKAASEHAIALGDFNIAPLPDDVWNHRALLKVVCHTPEEVAALDKMQQEGGWCDALRRLVPPPAKLYSWWSYRSPDVRASDRGRRLDLIWLSPSLTPFLCGGGIVRDARYWQTPSDHVPVWVDVAPHS